VTYLRRRVYIRCLLGVMDCGRRLLWALLVALLCTVGGAAETPWGKALPAERAVPSLEMGLQLIVEAVQQGALRPQDLVGDPGITMHEEHVVVIVEAGEDWELSALEQLGATVRHASPEQGLWEVHVPPAQLIELARLPGVQYVRSPHRPLPASAAVATGEGVPLTGAADWHAAGETGSGVRVAVIDIEFGGLTAAIQAGRLGPIALTRDYTGRGMETDGPHGTACAELVSSMAPGAELILMKIENEVQLSRAVSDAMELGARVISHSAGWLNTNFSDGTGVICQIVRRATDQGVLWVNAGGNAADGSHWTGNWADGGDRLLAFAPGQTVNPFTLGPGESVSVFLTWDAWPATDQDYDLYLVRVPMGIVVAQSTNTQDGTQPPGEAVHYRSTFGGTYGITVSAYDAPERPPLRLFTSSSVRLAHSTASGSIMTPGDAAEAVAVGAIPWDRWTTGPQAPYSSQGPTSVSRLNPRSITKPDICAPDSVATFSYAGTPYAGTSAAAPHVAGAAALLLSAAPDRSVEQVIDTLMRSAQAMGHSNIYGHGRLQLPAPSPAPPADDVDVVELPGGWNLISVRWAPSDPSPAAVFGDDIAPLRIWRWDASAGAYREPEEIRPQEGYWLRVPAGGAQITLSGSPVVGAATLPLDTAGWHMVSVPWTYPRSAILFARGAQLKSWREAVAAGWIDEVLWSYAPEAGYRQVVTLDPWRGYWLRTRVDRLYMELEDNQHAATGAMNSTSPYTHTSYPPPPPTTGSAHADLSTGCSPNPVTAAGPAVFEVRGPGADQIEEIAVTVFDLGGRKVWQGSAEGRTLTWKAERMANGSYLYEVRFKLLGEWINLGTHRLLILR